MDSFIEFTKTAWLSLKTYDGFYLLALLAIYAVYQQRWRLKRCEQCGERFKKVYDNMLVERITDSLLHRLDPQKEYAIPTYVCRGCDVEKNAL